MRNILNSKILDYFYYIAIIFIFLELISPSYIMPSIGGFPYSIGRLGFIVIGIMSINEKIIEYDVSVFFVGLMILGLILGSFYSVNTSKSISMALGQGLLYIASIGFGKNIMQFKNKLRVFDILFLLMFINWCYYLYLPLSKGHLNLAINFNSTLQDIKLFNKHTIGLYLSISSIYLFIRLIEFSKSKSNYNKSLPLYILAFIIIFITTYLLFIIQSRSTLLFVIMTLVIYFFSFDIKRNIKTIVLGLSLLFTTYYYIYNVTFHSNQLMNQRFELAFTEYQVSTVSTRFELYDNFLQHFIQNPLGIGLFEPYIDLGYIRALMHNQYLSFIVTAGVLGIIATYFLFIIIFRTLYKKKTAQIYRPLKYMLIFFLLKLFTGESGGLLFMFILSLLFELHRNIYQSHKI